MSLKAKLLPRYRGIALGIIPYIKNSIVKSEYLRGMTGILHVKNLQNLRRFSVVFKD
jgi:hypothetical protein